MQSGLSQALIHKISMQPGVHLSLYQIYTETSDKCLSAHTGDGQDPPLMYFCTLPFYSFYVTARQTQSLSFQ